MKRRLLLAAGLSLSLGCGFAGSKPKLGRPPASCRGSQTTQIQSVGRAIGESPLFAADFGRPRAVLHVENGPLTKYGWRVKVLFVLEAGANDPVSVRGRNLRTRRPIWFRVPPGAPTRAQAFDPAKPPVPPEAGSRWKDFPSYLFLPSAGCYRLEARWAGGSWAKTFAGGR
jgi:hypothetical protein